MALIDRSLIRIDGGTQIRSAIQYDIVEEYQEAYSRDEGMPPIVVFYDGSEYWLADGFHRHSANVSDEIEVDIKPGTREDAIWYACSANRAHGLQRSSEDKRRAIETALKHPHGAGKSDRAIAEHVGVSDKTVATVREKLGAEIPQPEKREGKDGKQYKPKKPAKPTKKRARASSELDGKPISDVHAAYLMRADAAVQWAQFEPKKSYGSIPATDETIAWARRAADAWTKRAEKLEAERSRQSAKEHATKKNGKKK
jgi:hypothetical protein